MNGEDLQTVTQFMADIHAGRPPQEGIRYKIHGNGEDFYLENHVVTCQPLGNGFYYLKGYVKNITAQVDVYKRQGMRAPMGVKVYGPTLEDIEQGGKAIEQALKSVPSVIPSSVFYDRAVGAPYLEIKLNRESMARYGVAVGDLQRCL